jgi:glycosyltransferase involved in cell wall biosynthesis
MEKPIRIGIILQSNKNWMGGIIYTKNLVNIISKQPLEGRTIEIYLIAASDSNQEVHKDLKFQAEDIIFTNSLQTSLLNRALWKFGKLFPLFRDRRLVKIINNENLDFLYPITGNNEISWNFECDWAAWIPDFQHKYMPDFFSSKEINSRNHIFTRISNEARKIAFSSQVALNDFKKFYPNSKARTYILRFSSIPDPTWFKEDPIQTQKRYSLPDNFFLVSNQFWKHKNHKIIVDALCLLREKELYPQIVCTGALLDSRFPGYVAELMTYIHECNLESQFTCLGLIPRNDQIQLTRRALCVIQPSLFEGWSTVVEDARLLGKTIILSDIPVHKEQDPPYGIFFQHASHKDLAEKISVSLTTLSPGPDIFLEEQSKEDNLSQSMLYAKSFYNMVLDKIFQ